MEADMSSRTMTLIGGALLLALLLSITPSVDAQQRPSRAWAANVVIPQARSFRTMPGSDVVFVTDVTARIDILEQVATTTLEIGLRNRSNRPQETELIVPVPNGAAVRDFTIQGKAAEAPAQLLPADEARKLYASIVAKLRDPGLLQFAGNDILRTSVFPVPPGGTQRIRIVYEHVLVADGARVDYVLPRTDALTYAMPWKISARIRTKQAIAAVYSPSHPISVTRSATNTVTATVPDQGANEPGSFQLSYLRATPGVSASLLAYPEAGTDGGFFLLLVGVPSRAASGIQAPSIRRELTLVLDRSGSMRGNKIEQVRESALQILAGLEDGERFNLITYNDAVESFSPLPVEKNAVAIEAATRYLNGLKAQGGTNLHGALVEALRQKPSAEFLPLVLFLTDGLPTVGERSEVAIRDVAIKGNPHKRRVFTIGVGVDVNTPLLDRIATSTRAKATFILPGEDVEVKVGQVFRRLKGPVLTSPALLATSSRDTPPISSGRPRVSAVYPRTIDDLFDGDQLVVLGRYHGPQPLAFELKGNYLGQAKTFRFRFGLDKATVRNAFVPRLWASRKIAFLTDEIRAAGADRELGESPDALANDPRLKELVDEIIRLSTKYGILTEYTAFLAEEGTDLSEAAFRVNFGKAAEKFQQRAFDTRAGVGAVNQELNNGSQRKQFRANFRNRFLDDRMKSIEIRAVQQTGDRTYFARGAKSLPGVGRAAWVDSRLLARLAEVKPAVTLVRGSVEYQSLAHILATSGRQGALALDGNLLLLVKGEVILIMVAGK
jgi:Ca-activated chloride channel homolog